MSEHFHHIQQRYLRRRSLLKLGGLGAASALLPLPNGVAGAARTGAAGFTPLPHGLSESHALAPGYHLQLLARWGDPLDGMARVSFPLSAAQQQTRFGYNNDFIAYTPIDGSRHGFLGVNHEYPISHLMFPGYTSPQDAVNRLSDDQVRCEMAAVGHSVLEVERTARGWQVVPGSRFQRRIDATTAVRFDGPAARHALLRTSADPEGVTVNGILGCCSGGKTPWGSVLIAEENVGDHFSGAAAGNAVNLLAQTDPADIYRRWADVDKRFDLREEPNELNRFGWVVEYDPADPAAMPVKHTALGRFEHESATVANREGSPLVVYSGDDSENEFVYRFVSSANYIAQRGKANSALLAEGVLYCARFNDDGSGSWLPLVHGSGPLTREAGFNDQGEVLVNVRRAATLLGATPMDRPEGIAISDANGAVYVALTKNKNKPAANAANPRSYNPAGHILEIKPPQDAGGARHWEPHFRWDLLLQAGDPAANGELRGAYGAGAQPGAWLANPDNLAFDARNRLWIATDGMEDFGMADGLWVCGISGSARAQPHQFLRCPRGAEPCSPEFTPDGKTLFVAIQHPAKESGSLYNAPSTRWPDFRKTLPPRPAIAAITKDDGGLIGD